VYYLELAETTDSTASVTDNYVMAIANSEVGRNYRCDIRSINKQVVFDPVFTTRMNSNNNCVVERNQCLDREVTGFYNLTIEVTR
jgi:hypothetical protein